MPHNGQKHVLFLRHGQCTHNVSVRAALTVEDSQLNAVGRRQAAAQARNLARDLAEHGHEVDLIVASPLRRTLETALILRRELGEATPLVACALCTERVCAACDRGTLVSELQREFGAAVDLDDLSRRDQAWWPAAEERSLWGAGGIEGVNGGELPEAPPALEAYERSTGMLRARADAFGRWVAARPEQNICVVGHVAFFSALLGHQLKNCEVYDCMWPPMWWPPPGRTLLPTPYIGGGGGGGAGGDELSDFEKTEGPPVPRPAPAEPATQQLDSKALDVGAEPAAAEDDESFHSCQSDDDSALQELQELHALEDALLELDEGEEHAGGTELAGVVGGAEPERKASCGACWRRRGRSSTSASSGTRASTRARCRTSRRRTLRGTASGCSGSGCSACWRRQRSRRRSRRWWPTRLALRRPSGSGWRRAAWRAGAVRLGHAQVRAAVAAERAAPRRLARRTDTATAAVAAEGTQPAEGLGGRGDAPARAGRAGRVARGAAHAHRRCEHVGARSGGAAPWRRGALRAPAGWRMVTGVQL